MLSERLTARLALTIFAVQALCCLGLVLSGCSPQDAAAYGLRPGAPLRPARAVASGAAADAGTADSGVDAGAAAYVDEFALLGDGATTYVDCDALYGETFGATSAWTACVRLKKSDAQQGRAFGIATNADSAQGIQCEFKADESIACRIGDSVNSISTAASVIPLDTWIVYCLAADATDAHLYSVTGSGATSIGSASTPASWAAAGTPRFKLGARVTASAQFADFPISEFVSTTNDRLSTTEMAELMTGGVWNDPLETSWSASVRAAIGLGDGDGDTATGTIENRVTGNTCTPTNYAAEDLVAGGEG